MRSPVASPNQIIILGAPMAPDPATGTLQLSTTGIERADRFLEYYQSHKRQLSSGDSLVVCSGGYSLLTAGMERPEDDSAREGILTADYLLGHGVPHRLLEIESESTSTLTNFLNSMKLGYLHPERYNPENPLGVVSQPGHLRRAAFFAAKLGVSREAFAPIATAEKDSAIREFALLSAYRVLFAGVSEPEELLRREQLPAKVLARIRR